MAGKFDELKSLQAKAQKIMDGAILEDRDLTDDERTELKKLYEEGKPLNEAVLKTQEDAEIRSKIMGWTVEKDEPVAKGTTVADRFLNDPRFQAWFKSIAPNGQIPNSLKGITSPPIEMRSFGLHSKALVTGLSDTSAGAFIQSEDSGIYEAIGYYPTVARNLISIRTTMSDAVDYVEQTTQPDDAAPVAEATSVSDGAKPETAVAYAKRTANVETIAVWIPATKRALADAPQIRGLINQELIADLNDELENQIFNGNGTSPQFVGIAGNASILQQAYATDLLTTTRKALTKLLKDGKDRPTAWVFSPTDWEAFTLLQDGDSRFYYGGPLSAAQDRLWGVPVVQSFHIADGYAYLANWRKAVLWDRQQASISISDSHSDFFVKNLVAILAEMRAAFAVTRPHSFVKVDLTAV